MVVALQHFKTENKHSAILITRFPVIFIDLKTDVRSQKSGKALASLVAPSPTPLIHETCWSDANDVLT